MSEHVPLLRPGTAAKEMRNGAKNVGRIPTGYSLDELGMVAPGELALIWARSGSGKSTWVLNVIANTPEVPTVIFNMEMRPESQAEWLAAMTQNLPVHAHQIAEVVNDRDHPDCDDVWSAVTDGLNDTLSFLVMAQPQRPKLTEMHEYILQAGEEFNRPVRRVFIDHLELVHGTEDYSQVKATLDTMHAWADKHKFALYVVQQTTRGGNGYKNDGHLPVTLSSGVYSGEAAADFIYGLYRPGRDPAIRDNPTRREALKNITRLQLIKNRPFAETNDDGIELEYVHYTRKLVEIREDTL